MGNLDVAFYNQILCIAKALNEHGIILNYDDAQMGRVSPKLIGEGYGIPLSKLYPIPVPEIAKEQMLAQGLKDFWDFYFYKETQASIRAEEKRKQKERKAQRKHWIFSARKNST